MSLKDAGSSAVNGLRSKFIHLRTWLKATYQRVGRTQVLLFVVLFAIAGVTLLILSHAETQIAVACPTDPGAEITSGWGWRPSTGSYHAGIDIGVDFRPIYAAETGQVIFAGANDGKYDGYQNTIDLRGASGRVYRYAHLSRMDVSAGTSVQAGQLMGQSGDGSGTLAAHLHWEIRTDGGGTGFDGTLDPTWAYQHCGGSDAPSGGNPAGTLNPTGTDCHNYTLQYDPSHYYPCVQHLQYDLGISADGYFGSGTKQAVMNLQAQHGLNQTGVVDPAPGTWCAIHSDLPGCPQAGPAPVAPAPAPAADTNQDPKGNVDIANCQHVAGWAYDPNDPGASIAVHIYIDGVGYNTGNTTTPRQDVNNAFGIPGTHGFDWPVPAQWHDGRSHNIIVFAINTPSGNNPIIGGGDSGVCAAPAAPAPAPTPVAPAPTPVTPTPVANGTKTIVGVASNRCVDVNGASHSAGATTLLWDCHSGANQQWTFSGNTISVYDGTAYRMCLDVNGGSTSNGASVIVWPCHGGTNQQWTRNGDGTIRSVASGKCLDAYGGGTGNGTSLIIWDCHGQTNQQWR